MGIIRYIQIPPKNLHTGEWVSDNHACSVLVSALGKQVCPRGNRGKETALKADGLEQWPSHARIVKRDRGS